MDRERVRLISASFPRLNNLRCIIGRISSTEIEDSSVKSLFHKRILNCRLLIYLIPEVIASPIMRSDKNGDIYILTTTDFLLTGKIQNKLFDLNIKYSESEQKEVTRKIYEACLNYTISFKISPQWNKVDEYFIQGKYFIGSLSYKINAIKMRIFITEEETRISASSTSVKVPSLSLEYFNLSSNIIKNFTINDNGFINLNPSESRSWVYVLPSLKRGKVVSIAKKIPETSPFKDYQQLKRHWKNMYGYRLPETDNELIYYQIYFPGLGPSFYTYPNCCVRSDKLQHLKLENREDVVTQFLKDLIEKFPKIFGHSLILRESYTCPSYNKQQEEDGKENILNMKSWVACNAGRILDRQETLQNDQSRLKSDLNLSGNYIYPLDMSCNKTDSYHRAFSTLSDNPGNFRPTRNIIKDKNLQEALSMEPFLRSQAANGKGSLSCYNKFLPVIGNTGFTKASNILEFAASSYSEEQRLRKALFSECSAKVETTCSPKSIKTDSDESLAAKESSVENKSFYDSLLRSRSSFDLNDFGVALSGEKYGKIDVISKIENNDVEKEVEIRSHYFEDLEKESQNKEKDLKSEATSSSKLKLYRLSNNRKKLTTPRVSRLKSERKDRLTVNFKTKDISTYFKERKQVKVSDLQDKKMKTSVPKFIQTQLNVKRTGKVELFFENKKPRLIDEIN